MPEFTIGETVMHGDTPVVVVFAFSDRACYVERGDRCRYRVMKSALTKGEPPVKPAKAKPKK